MIYGKLPFWGNSEEEFANAIINSKLTFDTKVPITEKGKKMI
jgi:hypothetical protein